MGRPKHSVVIPGDGRTFLDRMCDEIDHVYPSVVRGRYISMRPDQNIEREGYKCVCDRYEAIGPLGGIASVLADAKRDRFDAVLMLACDMTAYDSQEIINICERYDGDDILFARTDETDIEPLASIYGITVLDAIQTQIDNGDYRIRDLEKLVENIGYFDSVYPERYFNQNTAAGQLNLRKEGL
ncbi:MAG: NTP transferase domain-containing protein [Lachnospiraceae bacterium]|nr:NTP transferase domain-containing protein [Lachnospiraceae bacterium]